LLILIGIGAALQTWGGILIVLMVFGLTIGYRIKIEETFLISEFGDDYIQYMKKTKKLIPFVL
jgi:protein-S-isoprenylcysteine O-methyltransferase Ste14